MAAAAVAQLTELDRLKRDINACGDDIANLHHHREIAKGFHNVVQKSHVIHDQEPLFFQWTLNNWALLAVIGIRRQNDTDNDTISLNRIINRVIAARAETKRRFYNYPGDPECQADLVKLEATFDPVLKRFVNKSLAHITRKPVTPVTFDMIEKSLDTIGLLLQKYTLIITRSRLTQVAPVITSNWEDVFRKPWLT